MEREMKLIPDWKSAWKWLSVQIALAAAALQGVILAFPSVHDWLGDFTSHAVGLVMIVGLVMGRLIDQGKSTNG